MKRFSFFCFCFLFLTMSVASAQNTMQDVIYLKDNSVVRGIIIEQIPNESIRIQTENGTILSFSIEDIDRIAKGIRENSSVTRPQKPYKPRKMYEVKEYNGFVDVGFTLGIGEYGYSRFEVSTAHGYRFNPYIFAGLGVGIHYYDDRDLVLPVFANFRYSMLKTMTSPFIDLKGGYSFRLSGVFEDGLYFAPSVGLRFMAINNVITNFSIGYTYQMLGVYDSTTVSYISRSAGGVAFKLGVEF